MPDDLDSDQIARRSFEVSRRGYEQQEVRGFLHEVSALVQRLQREVADLEERATHAEAAIAAAGPPDEAMLLERLGEETTRVLTAAREAAAEIKAKAEVTAERVVADATLDAAEARAEAMRGADRRVEEAEAERESLLHTARTELDRRRSEAEEVAGQIRDEVAAEVRGQREQAQRDLARSHEEAEELVSAARAQGRDMVAEAQAVRERVLQDLAVRRKKARRQVEKLNAGRERLLQAYDVVRRLIDEATDELGVSVTDARVAAAAAAQRVEDEPEPSLEELDREAALAALADLQKGVDVDDDDDGAPGDGLDDADPERKTIVVEIVDDLPRPRRRRRRAFVGLPADEAESPAEPDEGAHGDRADVATHADLAAADAERDTVDASTRDAQAEAERAEASAEAERHADAQRQEEAKRQEAERQAEVERLEAAERERRAEAERAEAAVRDAAVEAERLEALEAERAAAEGVPAERDPVTDAALAAESSSPSVDDDAVGSPSVTALFERLRADQHTEAPAVEESAEEVDPSADEAEPTPFTEREAALEPIVKVLMRALKRSLADEQNEILDRLRTARPSGVDDLLPDPDTHAARWAEISAGPLGDAAAAGAAWAGGRAGSVADLADEAARSLTSPLRDRIDRGFAASDGNLDDVSDRARALYREWKGQRLAETAQHYAAAAYARGLYDALGAKASVHWVIDPSGTPCPDCDDNVLGGTIARGTEFPTGHDCAPAHPGCRCLVLATAE